MEKWGQGEVKRQIGTGRGADLQRLRFLHHRLPQRQLQGSRQERRSGRRARRVGRRHQDPGAVQAQDGLTRAGPAAPKAEPRQEPGTAFQRRRGLTLRRFSITTGAEPATVQKRTAQP